jgi:hypothetical protein
MRAPRLEHFTRRRARRHDDDEDEHERSAT